MIRGIRFLVGQFGMWSFGFLGGSYNVSLMSRADGETAGYSGTPLPKKLGIREEYSVLLRNAPARFERKLEPLPEGAEIVDDPSAARIAVLFAGSQAELAHDFRPLAKSLPKQCAVWIAWPKKASGVKSDLNENVVREFGLSAGWVDYKVCAIDETWSGLCFARRKA